MDDKDREFEIDLAKIGMSFGGVIAVAAALFAIGGELLLQLDLGKFFAGMILIIAAILISIYISHWRSEKLKSLSPDSPQKPEKTQQEKDSCKICHPSFWLSKTHDGVIL